MPIVLNYLYLMDCLEFLKLLADNSVDLIIIDPPFGVSFGGNKFFNDSYKYVESHIDDWFAELYRVLKPGCHIFIYTPTLNIDLFASTTKKYFKLVDVLTARAKSSTKQRAGTFRYDSQLILHATKGQGRLLNKVNIQKKSDYWLNDKRNTDPNPYTYHYSSILEDRANAEIRVHPNAKNIAQLEKLILLASDEGDVVLDIFAGQGSTAIAARNLNRNFLTCDLVDYGQLPVAGNIIDTCCGSASFLVEVMNRVAQAMNDNNRQ